MTFLSGGPNHAQTMMLREREVHVWLAHVDALRDATLRATAMDLLLPEERDSWQRFVRQHSREEYLLTRLLCRHVLSHVTAVPPIFWQFMRNHYGRPAIAAPAPYTRLTFNLSNTRNWVACGVAYDVELGVDIERASRSSDIEGLSRAVLSASERATLLALPPAEQIRHFFTLWTVKEAYIKARGQGISMGVKNMTVHLTPPPIRLTLPEQWQDAPQHWQIHAAQAADDLLLGVAVRRGMSPDFPIIFHTGVPPV